jgi:hypothetical protein
MTSTVHGCPRGLVLVLLWATLSPHPARAAGTLQACRPDTPEHQAARTALDELDRQLRSIPPSAAVEPYNRKLADLLAMPCFRLSAEHARDITAQSALSLRNFWMEGGEEWLRSYLSLRGPKPDVVLPPDLRPALASDGDHGELPSALLCPAADERCGQETAGWLLRSERALAALARSPHTSSSPPGPVSPEVQAKRCWQKARRKPAAEQYLTWRTCLEEARPRVPALPLGAFRAPRTGWWIIRGRRGHYHFCDEVRAYDLKSGAAYVASSCSGLILEDTGAVAHDETDAGRRVSVRMGRLSVDNLREAALMAALTKQVNEVQVEAASYPLPVGLVPRWPEGRGIGMGFSGSFSWSSAQTVLSWTLSEGDQISAEGQLTWPDSAEPADQNAVELLQVAEAGFEEGCPPAPLPEILPMRQGRPGVSGIDARPETLTLVQQDLMKRLQDAARSQRCK